MANFVLSRADLFPDGTVVKAYLESVERGRAERGVAPTTTEVESQTVSSGTATFTTLTAGRQYLLHGTVSSSQKFMRVTGPGTATIGLAGVSKPSWKTRREALGLH